MPRKDERRFATPCNVVSFGIHLGDVIEKADGAVYGDGVNIAARLEALAEPGGITISDAVQGAVRGKVAASFVDQGEQQVKNIPYPVRAFAARTDGNAAAKPSPAAGEIDLSLPDKPSIAVLPFANMSGDPGQEYFTDGMSEDIILQDAITQRIVAIVAPEVERAEQKRSVAKEATNLAAWEYYQRGMVMLEQYSKQGNAEARAHVGAGRYDAAAALARKTINLRIDYPASHYILASALGHLGRLDEALAALAECERLQPGYVARRARWQPYRDAAKNEHLHAGARAAQANP